MYISYIYIYYTLYMDTFDGIVGAQVPLGAGMAFGAKYLTNKGLARGEAPSNAVAFAMFGDGAANQGQVV